MRQEEVVEMCDQAREKEEGVGLSDFLATIIRFAYVEGFVEGKKEGAEIWLADNIETERG